MVYYEGMIADQINRNKRVDLGGISTEGKHGVAHRRQVNERRNAGKVLHQHPRRSKGNLAVRLSSIVKPSHYSLNIAALNRATIFVPKEILENDFQRDREAANTREAIPFCI